ncbi:DMT family transporter [Neobacillus pocheonensis]|uniref:DMT family transporter n=1 Tax=Neobacillus pocheonensis TaxID=363869 RepID=A0ABT0WF49_9BACI|nr:DMT family transporter [Neobacillus pocheonensis]
MKDVQKFVGLDVSKDTIAVAIVGAGKAAPFINLLPVWTVIFGVFLLHEQVSLMSLLVGIVTIAGAVLASL